jgi:hypothetical protein
MQADAFKMRDLANRCLKRLFNKHIVGKRIRHEAAVTLSSVAITRGVTRSRKSIFFISKADLERLRSD